MYNCTMKEHGSQHKNEEREIASDLLSEVEFELSVWNRGSVTSVGYEDIPNEDNHDYFYIEGRSLPRNFGNTDLPAWATWSHSYDGGPYDHREVVEVNREAWRDAE